MRKKSNIFKRSALKKINSYVRYKYFEYEKNKFQLFWHDPKKIINKVF